MRERERESWNRRHAQPNARSVFGEPIVIHAYTHADQTHFKLTLVQDRFLHCFYGFLTDLFVQHCSLRTSRPLRTLSLGPLRGRRGRARGPAPGLGGADLQGGAKSRTLGAADGGHRGRRQVGGEVGGWCGCGGYGIV